jgi:hypothetical protein
MMDALIISLLVLCTAVLLFIANELRAITRELSRNRDFSAKRMDAHDAAPAGPTINVNLAPGTGAPSAVSSVRSAVPELVDDGQADAAGEKKDVPTETVKKAQPSGAIAVICPRCKLENSAYRIECFNCGSAL